MRKCAVLCVSVSENSLKTIAVKSTVSSCLNACISMALLHKSRERVSHTLKKRKLHSAENSWHYHGLYSSFWVHKKAVGSSIWEHTEYISFLPWHRVTWCKNEITGRRRKPKPYRKPAVSISLKKVFRNRGKDFVMKFNIILQFKRLCYKIREGWVWKTLIWESINLL